MGKDGTQAPVTFRHIAQRQCQEVQADGDLIGDLRAGEQPRPRRRQLQAQRHPLHQPANADDSGERIGVGGEVVVDPRGAFEEKADCAIRFDIVSRLLSREA